jgi:5'(3')-deoxyribonucleotidase
MIDEPVALIDLDGTLADYDGAMTAELLKLQSPHDPPLDPADMGKGPPWLEARRHLVKQIPGFWRNLPRIPAGFEVLDEIRAAGFRMMVLTNGPWKVPAAWSEKVLWCQEHLPAASITVGRDKSLVYGRVLFDDWPPYVERWLRWRPRGLVIMLDHARNRGFTDPRVLRYTGAEKDELRARLERAASGTPEK